MPQGKARWFTTRSFWNWNPSRTLLFRGFHVKLHGLVKIKISMLASIMGEYEIADHKESPGLQQPRWPWGLPKPLVSPAGRIVIPKLLRGPFLTFIIHCNETKALRRKTTKKNIVTVFGQDPTMTRLDTTVCNHALFLRHPKREVYILIFRLISTYNSFGHKSLRLDTSLPTPSIESFDTTTIPFFWYQNTHKKQHGSLKPGGGWRWYKPSYESSSRKLHLQGESDSPRQRVEGELILYFHPSTFRIRMNQLKDFFLVVDCVDGWWMVLKKIRVRCLWIFFGEVGWSWGTDSFLSLFVFIMWRLD